MPWMPPQAVPANEVIIVVYEIPGVDDPKDLTYAGEVLFLPDRSHWAATEYHDRLRPAIREARDIIKRDKLKLRGTEVIRVDERGQLPDGSELWPMTRR